MKAVPQKAHTEEAESTTPAIAAERRRALLASQAAIEAATDKRVRAQAAVQRAQAEHALADAALTEAVADQQLLLKLALKEGKRSGDEWSIDVDTATERVEFRRREDAKPKG